MFPSFIKSGVKAPWEKVLLKKEVPKIGGKFNVRHYYPGEKGLIALLEERPSLAPSQI